MSMGKFSVKSLSLVPTGVDILYVICDKEVRMEEIAFCLLSYLCSDVNTRHLCKTLPKGDFIYPSDIKTNETPQMKSSK